MKKILLIGDSIRQGYDKYVKMAFEGIAEVYYPDENCRFTSYIIRRLGDWRVNLQLDEKVDLIHWNAGLWDDLVMQDGRHLIALEQYRENVERICGLMQKMYPHAKIIFATSTPVREELFGVCKRYNKDTEAYNCAASEIVQKYGGTVNDLYTLMKQAPVDYHSDLTHYYTKDGTRIMTNQVVKCIEDALGLQAKTLDYDRLFAEKEDALGF